MPQEHAHLFRFQPALHPGHVRDDEQVVVVLLGLRTLVCVDHIFQGQRMEVEQFTDRLDRFGVAESLDVDPGDGRLAEQLAHLVAVSDALLGELIGAVGNNVHDRRAGRGIGDNHPRQIAWLGEARKPRPSALALMRLAHDASLC